MRRTAWVVLLMLAGSTGCAHEHLSATPMSLPSENGGLFDSVINHNVAPGSPTL